MADVRKELIKTADLIRKKYRALKRGHDMMEETRVENFRPITEPLKELINVQKTTPLLALSPPRSPTPPHLPSITEGFQSHAKTITISKIATGYLNYSFKKGNDADHTYGIRYDNMAYKIGNKVIKIKNNDIIVGDTPYKGTQGLWELITLKKPKEYTQDDLDTYKKLLLQTNAHLKNYKDGAQISSNRYPKYTDIIKPLFQSTGGGLMLANDNEIEHRYWDDPNKLVNQLRVLHLSKGAGNTGVDNEIQSIIDALIERKIIVRK